MAHRAYAATAVSLMRFEPVRALLIDEIRVAVNFARRPNGALRNFYLAEKWRQWSLLREQLWSLFAIDGA